MSAELCRLCGKDGVTNVHDETDLWRKIFVCFSVEINTSDKVTQKICKSCYFFTNSVYEFRLSSIEHDNKLKKEYAETVPKVEPAAVIPISYPSEISQDAFLNTLNLANKNEPAPKTPVYHPSVQKLKRKWPNINIPKECYNLNIDPTISLENPPKLLKLSSPKMGIWSVKNTQNRGKQPDLVLTRVHSVGSTESLNSSVSDISDKLKVKFAFKKINNSETSDTPASTSRSASPRDGSPKKKRKRYPDWSKSGRRRFRGSPQKKISSNEPKGREGVPQTIPKEFKSPTKSNNSSISVSSAGNIAKERSKLKSLLETDVQLNETLPRRRSSDRSNTSLSQEFKSEEYGNLLVAAGEEVQTFICQTCNKIFDTLALLNVHKRYSHKSSLRCTKCSKKFAIVESLVKHNITFHPETVANANSSATKDNLETVVDANSSATKDNLETVVNAGNSTENNLEANTNAGNSETKDNSSTVVRSTVARKHTNGGIDSNRSSFSAPTPPEILEYVISDDDDIEILDVIENATSPSKKELSFDNIINAALKPQKPSNSDEINAGSRFCDNLISAALAEDKQKQTVESAKNRKMESKGPNEDIFLIDDSDDEKDQNKKNSTTNKENDNNDAENSFLILDDSNSAELIPLSENSIQTSSGSTEGNVSQKIVVVPSAEDKAHMDASSSIKAKITNEISYINYIFNKCSFNYINGDSTKPVRPAKKWFLKDVHKFTEKTYLPIKVNWVTGSDISVEYSPVPPEKKEAKLPFWATKTPINVTKKRTKGTESHINPQPQPKTNIVKESSFVSQPVAKQSTVNKNPEEKPVSNQTKVNPEEGSVPRQPKVNVGVGSTSQPTASSALLPTNNQTPVVVQSEIKVSSAGPISKVNSTITPTSTPVSLVKTTNIQQTTSNIVSNTVFVVTSQPSSQPGSIQLMNSSANGTLPNNPRASNVLLPSVAVPPPVLQNVQSPPNIDIHTTQRLLTLALQNAAMNYTQQKSNVCYSKALTPVLSKSTLPVSSPKESGVNSSEVQDPCNGFILVGLANTPNENGPLDESKDSQKQPVVLNGMSYPSFTKIQNSNQPTTLVVQQVGQQTNLNIQNCVNICQQEVVTQTNTVTEQFAAVPYVVQKESTASTITFPTGPLNVPSMNPILQSVLSPSNETAETNKSESTSDATVSTTRPTIRIKNLSELRGDNLNTNQRNELHNLYSNTLTNYVQNYSNAVTNKSPNDEYLQIS